MISDQTREHEGGGAMRGGRGTNTERRYRHCQGGDLLQEAGGNGEEEEVRQKDHRRETSEPKAKGRRCGGGGGEASPGELPGCCRCSR